MKIKTSELTGAALDWAAATCDGVECDELHHPIWFKEDGPFAPRVRYTPSTDWSQGGPIIEREGIAVDCIRCDGKIDGWIAALPMICEAKYEEPAPTPLIAAMRCFVASRLGDEVDIPDELC